MALALKRSISQPCTGEKKVWSTISIVKATCTAARLAPVVAWNGFTNSVQTYCGLEIVIMTRRPRASWIHRVRLEIVFIIHSHAARGIRKGRARIEPQVRAERSQQAAPRLTGPPPN